MSFSNQLVILVGGKGTRLGAQAQNTPKPLMPINGDKVFLDYFLESAIRQGFTDVLMLAGHLGDQVYERYNNQRFAEAHINVVVEPLPLGTGGAIRNAISHLAPTFVAANGDTMFDTNIRALDHHLQTQPNLMATLAIREVEDAGRFGSVDFENGIIRSFREKDSRSEAVKGVVNGGIYAIRRESIELLQEGNTSIEADLFPMLAHEGALGGQISNGYFLDIGLPHTLEQARYQLPKRQRPALFLDRDGVINKEKNYLYQIEDFEWIDGVIELIFEANTKGFAVIVVSNQAGVARGFYSEGDVLRLHAFIQDKLNAEGAFIDAFYYCPYHSEAKLDRFSIEDHFDRKPNPGMILKAANAHNLDLSKSVMVGDQLSDMEAAKASGVLGFQFEGGNLKTFIDAHNILDIFK
jgi:D,D-heptose 1,7-bisphosphate phosphatase